MKRIPITNDIRAKAIRFRSLLSSGLRRGYISPKQRLKELVADLQDNTDKQYVQLIIDEWDVLIVATPDEFDALESKFKKIICTESIGERLVQVMVLNRQKGVKELKTRYLYKLIVDAMKYEYVQSTIYPVFITELNIKACVYCNAQYAFSVAGRNGYQNYELDHFKPKSKYPYLCTTFMNLQPSCATCNKKKSDKEPLPDEEAFQLFVAEGTTGELSPVKFELDNASAARYLADPNNKTLIINFSCPNNPKLEKCFNRFFDINTLYQAHTDIAEELIWKSQIYNHVIINDYKRLFRQLGFRDSDFMRFIIGNYDLTDDIHKRPLSKLTQDIAKQLKIIK